MYAHTHLWNPLPFPELTPESIFYFFFQNFSPCIVSVHVSIRFLYTYILYIFPNSDTSFFKTDAVFHCIKVYQNLFSHSILMEFRLFLRFYYYKLLQRLYIFVHRHTCFSRTDTTEKNFQGIKEHCILLIFDRNYNINPLSTPPYQSRRPCLISYILANPRCYNFKLFCQFNVQKLPFSFALLWFPRYLRICLSLVMLPALLGF